MTDKQLEADFRGQLSHVIMAPLTTPGTLKVIWTSNEFITDEIRARK